MQTSCIMKILYVIFCPSSFCTLHSLANLFSSYLFPSFGNDTHIIGHALVVYKVFHHFSSQLDLVNLAIEYQKCVIWSPSRLPLGLLLGFSLPSRFIPLLGALGFGCIIKKKGVLQRALQFNFEMQTTFATHCIYML